MQHPFSVLKPEYAQLLAGMRVLPAHQAAVDHTAAKLLACKSRYQAASLKTGVPIVFIASSFEREAASNFRLNPAQGWPLTSVSRLIPHNGPFRSWDDAAIAAYHIDGLDRVGAANWTWEYACFYGESFNGFGPRGHGRHTGYLWAGTNIYNGGKYRHDGPDGWDPNYMDPQLGMIPVARRMVELDASLALPTAEFVPPAPVQISLGTSEDHPGVDAKWVQHALNELGYEPALLEDGNYGRRTKYAVEQFQRSYRLDVDGLAGKQTIAALKEALAAKQEEPTT